MTTPRPPPESSQNFPRPHALGLPQHPKVPHRPNDKRKTKNDATLITAKIQKPIQGK
jgi:hypothetical protein